MTRTWLPQEVGKRAIQFRDNCASRDSIAFYKNVFDGVPFDPDASTAWKTIPITSDASVVYFAASWPGNRIKIGKTKYGLLHDRISDLQCGNPYELRLLFFVPGEYQLETWLHRRFQHLRIRGEWFINRGDLRYFIECHLEPDELGFGMWSGDGITAKVKCHECGAEHIRVFDE